MEFTDLASMPPTKGTNESMNGMWDFDLLGKSDADVFDVNFLQSQANDHVNRERTNQKANLKNDNPMHEEKDNEQAEKVHESVPVDVNDQRLKDEKLAKLVSAGFDAQKAYQALKNCQWDVEMAVDILFNQGGSPTRENQSKSPMRQSEVFQSIGMSVFKGAQKVFDYSKKKITQVVESSKSSGWMSELNSSNEKSDYYLERPSRDALSPTSNLGVSENPILSERLEGSRLKDQLGSRPNKPVRSFNQSDLPNTSTAVIQKKEVTVKPARVDKISKIQKIPESLLISGLIDSPTTSTISDMKIKKESMPSFGGNQSLGLLDSSIEFNLSGSNSILNPTVSAHPLKSGNSKHQEDILTYSVNFPSNASSGHFSQAPKNIPSIPNKSAALNMSKNDSISKAQSVSDPPLTQSWTNLNSFKQSNPIHKPINQVKMNTIDPFLGISALGKASTNSSAENLLSSKKQSTNAFNVTQTNSAASRQSQGGSSSKNNNTQPNNGRLLDDPFDFSLSGKGMINPSTNKIALPSNLAEVGDTKKKAIDDSFKIFDSIHDKSNIISTNTDQLKTYHKSEVIILKEKGNEFFKAGQYSQADGQYTLAINSLSDKHPLLAVLYNNRAGARLKTGSYLEAINDCNQVQELEPNEVKSLLRRAQAYESLEKWEEAQSDYRAILVIDPTVKSLSQSLVRCSKALQSLNTNQTQVTRTKKLPDRQNVLPPSNSSFSPKTIEVTAAVQLIREKNKQAESEDALKLALKDQIDEKIHSWRKGKEDNLRALLSSLDTVLWKELEWKTINLSEILTQSQVKVKYLRAISKVHPDKLGSNISVENQLIANSVFSTLNKAWDTFKTQNGM